MIILVEARNDSAEVEGVSELERSTRSGVERHIRGCRGSEFDGEPAEVSLCIDDRRGGLHPQDNHHGEGLR